MAEITEKDMLNQTFSSFANQQDPAVVVDPVVADPAVVADPVITDPVTYDKDWFKTNLGIENPDELKGQYENYKTKATDYDTIKPEYDTLKTKPEPVLTPFAKIANELEQKGIKPATIARFHGLEPDKLSIEERLDLAEELKTPELTKEQRQALLTERYYVDEDAPDWKKSAIEARKVQDAQIASGEINKHVAEVFNPETKPVNQELVKQETNRVSYFQQNNSQIDTKVLDFAAEIKEKAIGRQGEELLPADFKYEMPADRKQTLLNTMAQVVQNPANANLFTPDANGLAKANEQLNALFWAQEGKNIAQQLIANHKVLASKLHEHYATLMHNPSRKDGLASQKTGTLNAADQFNQNAANAFQKLQQS